MKNSSIKTHSCLIRPAGDTYIQIHQCDIDLCNGNQCAAALIRFFEHWHNNRLENQKKAAQANDIAEAHGDRRSHSESLLQWHTEAEIINAIKVFRKDSIAKALKLLTEKNIITLTRNPNPRYKFDHTRFFMFHPDTVNALYGSKDSSAENRSPQAENRAPQAEDQRTIELYSSINSKNDFPSYSPPVEESQSAEEGIDYVGGLFPEGTPREGEVGKGREVLQEKGFTLVTSPESQEGLVTEIEREGDKGKEGLRVGKTPEKEKTEDLGQPKDPSPYPLPTAALFPENVAGEGAVGKGRELRQELGTPLTPSSPKKVTAKKKGASSLDATEVLGYLNLIAERNYLVPGEIAIRLSQGATVDECKLVIDYLGATRNEEWKRDWFDQDAPFRKGNFGKNLEKAKAWCAKKRTLEPSPTPSTRAPDADLLAMFNDTVPERSHHAPR